MNPDTLVYDFLYDEDHDWYMEWRKRKGTLDELIKRYNEILEERK